ncbi:MAG TPA: hypothetical protein PK095_08855 [Myxococcota bacterium]|nr:hypothetical protein [Myxococcota bacterium]
MATTKKMSALWCLLLGGCASAAPRPAPVAEAVVAPAPEPEQAYAVFGSWAHVGAAAEHLPGFVSGQLALDDQGFATVYAEVPKERLMGSLRALSGKKMKAVAETGGSCEVVLGRVVVGAQLIDSDRGYHALFDATIYNDDGDEIGERPEQERYAEALEGRPLSVLVELLDAAGARFEQCADGETAHHVASGAGEPLVEQEASAEMIESGLRALREHGFWEVQQAGYQRSVERLREESRREYEARLAAAKRVRATKKEVAELEDERDKRADYAPATWEAKPVGPEDQIWGYEEPSGTVWSDGRGARFLVVKTGNDVSCAAPRAWMLFQVDGAELTPLDFGILGGPSQVLSRDGGFDVLMSWPTAVARVVGGQLSVVAPPSVDAAPHCSWGQIPPVQGEPGGGR